MKKKENIILKGLIFFIFILYASLCVSLSSLPVSAQEPESSQPQQEVFADIHTGEENVVVRENTANFYAVGIAAWAVVGIVFLGVLLFIINNPTYKPRQSGKMGFIGNPKDSGISRKAIHVGFVMKSPQQIRRYSKYTDRKR